MAASPAFASILLAVLIVMISLGIENPLADIQPTIETSLVSAFTSASNIILSFGKFCCLWR